MNFYLRKLASRPSKGAVIPSRTLLLRDDRKHRDDANARWTLTMSTRSRT